MVMARVTKGSAEIFASQRDAAETELVTLGRQINRIGNLRLVVFLCGTAWAVLGSILEKPLLGWIGAAAFLCVFVWLVLFHDQLHRKRKRQEVYRDINQEAFLRCTDAWHGLEVDGKAYLDPQHPYAGDLDLFGPGSLFQWCNTAVTPVGMETLACWWTHPEQRPSIIRMRQEAVLELAPLLKERQEIQLEARLHEGRFSTADDLSAWVGGSTIVRNKSERVPAWMPAGVWMLPIVTWGLFLASWVVPGLAGGFWLLPLIIQILLVARYWRHCEAALRAAERAAQDMKVHASLLEKFEKLPVQSASFQEMRRRVANEAGQPASVQASRLAKLVDLMGNRNHQLYLVVNLLFLTDWHFLMAVAQWKDASGGRLAEWVAVNGELEAFCALAGIAYAHPDWVFPTILDGGEEDRFFSEALGHPLLKQPPVTNSVQFGKDESVLLVTGSNMSGKSTLLRTVGINLVLAMAGAPVFAKNVRFTPCKLHTCMRIRDDLEQGISSFYAELLRIRQLVETIETGANVFFFLDEIFRGTNSADRHAGASALIRWLMAKDGTGQQVTGFISTHDLALAELPEQWTGIRNVHFQESYEDGILKFDYLLREGVSTTRNAQWLMKLAGLPVEWTEEPANQA